VAFNAPEVFSALSLAGGTLAGSGDVTVTGPLSWTSGTMSGPGRTVVAAGGTLALSGSGHFLGRVLQSDGAASWTAGELLMNSGTLLNNGSFTASTAAGDLSGRGYPYPGGANAFVNAGTFTQ